MGGSNCCALPSRSWGAPLCKGEAARAGGACGRGPPQEKETQRGPQFRVPGPPSLLPKLALRHHWLRSSQTQEERKDPGVGRREGSQKPQGTSGTRKAAGPGAPPGGGRLGLKAAREPPGWLGGQKKCPAVSGAARGQAGAPERTHRVRGAAVTGRREGGPTCVDVLASEAHEGVATSPAPLRADTQGALIKERKPGDLDFIRTTWFPFAVASSPPPPPPAPSEPESPAAAGARGPGPGGAAGTPSMSPTQRLARGAAPGRAGCRDSRPPSLGGVRGQRGPAGRPRQARRPGWRRCAEPRGCPLPRRDARPRRAPRAGRFRGAPGRRPLPFYSSGRGPRGARPPVRAAQIGRGGHVGGHVLRRAPSKKKMGFGVNLGV